MLAVSLLFFFLQCFQRSDYFSQSPIRIDTAPGDGAMSHLAVNSNSNSQCSALCDTTLVFFRFTNDCTVNIIRPALLNEMLNANHHSFFINRNGQDSFTGKCLFTLQN